MPTYEFLNCDGLQGPEGEVYEAESIAFEVDLPMTQAPSIGQAIECPADGYVGNIVRIASLVGLIVKGEFQPSWSEGQTLTTKDRDGGEIRMQFLDHRHTAPEHTANLNRAAQQLGLKNKVRRDPGSGRMVVDVVSNIPDPLGTIERDKRARGIKPEKKVVGTPYKQRKIAKGTKPRGYKPTDRPLPAKKT